MLINFYDYIGHASWNHVLAPSKVLARLGYERLEAPQHFAQALGRLPHALCMQSHWLPFGAICFAQAKGPSPCPALGSPAPCPAVHPCAKYFAQACIPLQGQSKSQGCSYIMRCNRARSGKPIGGKRGCRSLKKPSDAQGSNQDLGLEGAEARDAFQEDARAATRTRGRTRLHHLNETIKNNQE